MAKSVKVTTPKQQTAPKTIQKLTEINFKFKNQDNNDLDSIIENFNLKLNSKISTLIKSILEDKLISNNLFYDYFFNYLKTLSVFNEQKHNNYTIRFHCGSNNSSCIHFQRNNNTVNTSETTTVQFNIHLAYYSSNNSSRNMKLARLSPSLNVGDLLKISKAQMLEICLIFELREKSTFEFCKISKEVSAGSTTTTTTTTTTTNNNNNNNNNKEKSESSKTLAQQAVKGRLSKHDAPVALKRANDAGDEALPAAKKSKVPETIALADEIPLTQLTQDSDQTRVDTNVDSNDEDENMEKKKTNKVNVQIHRHQESTVVNGEKHAENNKINKKKDQSTAPAHAAFESKDTGFHDRKKEDNTVKKPSTDESSDDDSSSSGSSDSDDSDSEDDSSSSGSSDSDSETDDDAMNNSGDDSSTDSSSSNSSSSSGSSSPDSDDSSEASEETTGTAAAAKLVRHLVDGKDAVTTPKVVKFTGQDGSLNFPSNGSSSKPVSKTNTTSRKVGRTPLVPKNLTEKLSMQSNSKLMKNKHGLSNRVQTPGLNLINKNEQEDSSTLVVELSQKKNALADLASSLEEKEKSNPDLHSKIREIENPKISVQQMKSLCKSLNLPMSGNKGELKLRLEEWKRKNHA